MKAFLEIVDVFAREILDLYGNPAIEVEVIVSNDEGKEFISRAAALLDVSEMAEKAVSNVNDIIADVIIGLNALDQAAVDKKMNTIDDTPNKSKLSASAILGVSSATAKAAAKALGLPLYQYLGGFNAKLLPIPLVSVINGEKRAGFYKDFMIVPAGASSFKEALKICAKVYHTLKEILNAKGLCAAADGEDGFTPDSVLDVILDAIEKAGYKKGADIRIAIDAAANEIYNKNDKLYHIAFDAKKESTRTSAVIINEWERLVNKYPIISIENGIACDDTEGLKALSERLGKKVQLVGGSSFAAGAEGANSVLIRLNQAATLTEVFDTIELAARNKMAVIISGNPNDTEDSIIADLAVSVNAGRIKAGAMAQSGGVAVYNRLLRIEEELEGAAGYPHFYLN